MTARSLLFCTFGLPQVLISMLQEHGLRPWLPQAPLPSQQALPLSPGAWATALQSCCSSAQFDQSWALGTRGHGKLFPHMLHSPKPTKLAEVLGAPAVPCRASPPLLNSTPPHRPSPNNPHWPGQSQPETGKESPAKEEVWYCCLHLQGGHLGITVHVSDTKPHPTTVRRCLNFLYQAKTQQQFSPYP